MSECPCQYQSGPDCAKAIDIITELRQQLAEATKDANLFKEGLKDAWDDHERDHEVMVNSAMQITDLANAIEEELITTRQQLAEARALLREMKQKHEPERGYCEHSVHESEWCLPCSLSHKEAVMRWPIDCCSCGCPTSLQECAFRTNMCDCELGEPCKHGVCIECRNGGDDWKRITL